jgi:hypothetical protein
MSRATQVTYQLLDPDTRQPVGEPRIGTYEEPEQKEDKPRLVDRVIGIPDGPYIAAFPDFPGRGLRCRVKDGEIVPD